MSNLSDFEFLLELIRQTDATPGEDVTAQQIAAALGHDDSAALTATVQRLKNRGLLDWAPGPSRLGDGWTSSALLPTPAGYQHDGTGLR